MADENPLARSHKLLWEGLPEPKKGPKPTLTLEQIVAAAIAIADADGIDALSMRKLAAALDMGTMSLYRYVPSKTELLNLMLDHVSSTQEGTRTGAGWRDTLESSAWTGRSLYLAHPWLLQVNWARPVLGPNIVAGLESTMSDLKDLPFSDQEKIKVISLLDSYVTGSAREEILQHNAAAETGMTDDEFWGYQLPVLVKAMESGNFPTLAAMSEDTFDATAEATFEFGLTFLLDGIAREVDRRAAD